MTLNELFLNKENITNKIGELKREIKSTPIKWRTENKISVKKIIEDIRRSNKYLLFGILCLLVILITYLTSNMLISDELYFTHFGEQMTFEQINSLLDFQYKNQWISYMIIPVVYLIKFMLVAIVLLTGSIFYNIKITFKKLFQIALVAEFLFFVPSFIKLVWFLLVNTDYELIDLQSFYPLSLLNLTNVGSLPQWLLYPLQLVNVFEIIYWFLLAYGISLVARERLTKMLGLVASSYGVGLFVWVIFITFLTINLS